MEVKELFFGPTVPVPLRIKYMKNKHKNPQSLCLNQLNKFISHKIYNQNFTQINVNNKPETTFYDAKNVKKQKGKILSKCYSSTQPIRLNIDPSFSEFISAIETNQPLEQRFKPYNLLSNYPKLSQGNTFKERTNLKKYRLKTMQNSRQKKKLLKAVKSERDSILQVDKWQTERQGQNENLSFILR